MGVSTLINAIAGSTFMSKTQFETYELLNEMVMNKYQWPNEKVMPKKAARIYEIDAIIPLTTQVASLTK